MSKAWYSQKAADWAGRLRKKEQLRNAVTLLKLLLFGAAAWGFYRFLSSDSGLWLFVGFALAFSVLTVFDTRLVLQIRYLKIALNEVNREIAYLEGTLQPGSGGHSYVNANHRYASDLDLFGDDSLFAHIDRTVTPNGSHKLAQWLMEPCNTGEEILSRQEAAGELAALPDFCFDFRTTGRLYPTEGSDLRIMHSFGLEMPFFKATWPRFLLWCSNGCTLLFVLLWVAGVMRPSLPLFFLLLQLLLSSLYLGRINSRHQKMGHFFRSLGNLFHLVEKIKSASFSSSGLEKVQHQLKVALHAFSLLKRVAAQLDQRNNVLVAFVLNALYTRDLHLMIRLDQWQKFYAESVPKWIDALADADAWVSMAVYRMNHPDFSLPVVDNGIWLEATGAGHPCLPREHCVTNSLTVEGSQLFYVVTGANMAGKSTFLRSIGLNLVLALSGNVVCAERFRFRPMELFSSMRTTDNLARGTSYFQAELLRLQQLTECAKQNDALFVLLDEMLKGTNSTDKLHGSMQFLFRMLSYPVSGLVATHDLAMANMALEQPGHFRNVCFEISHTDGEILYDYKLREGVSRTMNATLLMQQMGLI